MTDYFVAANGNDTNDGLTLATPFRSITRVNTLLNNATITRGDTVYFRRGDTFYGKLRPLSLTYTRAGDVRFMPYSALPIVTKPILSSYKLLDIPTGWTLHAAGVWKIDLANAAHGTTHTGYDGAQGGASNVGFLKVDGVIWGAKKFTLGALSAQWDFFNDGTTLYVRTSDNPTALASDIRASTDGDGITVGSSHQILGLHVTGSGGCGIAGSSRRSAIYGNRINECGGSALVGYGDGTTRYGNGIQIWIGSRDSVIELNTISETFDVGYTLQGSESSITPNIPRFVNVHFRRNLIYNCTQSIEFWTSGTPSEGTGFINCSVTHNLCIGAGRGQLSKFRPTQINCVHVLTYSWQLPASLDVSHNVFVDAASAYTYASGGLPTGMNRHHNLVILRPGTPLSFQVGTPIEEAATWATEVGNDSDTEFVATMPEIEGLGAVVEWLVEQGHELPHAGPLRLRVIKQDGQAVVAALT